MTNTNHSHLYSHLSPTLLIFYSDGTTHVIFEPLDFIAKLAALVPKPRVNLTRFHGVFAPNSKCRVDVTPAKRGKGRARKENEDKTPEQRHQAMAGFLLLRNRHTVHPWT